MTKAKVHALPKPLRASLTDEEKKQQLVRFIAQKREQFATGAVFNMLGNPSLKEINPKLLAKEAVAIADAMIEELYPIQQEEKKDE